MIELKERILAATAMVPSSSRSVARRQRLVLIAASLAAMVAIYLTFVLWLFGWQSIPRSTTLAGGTLLGASAVAALAMTTAVGRGRSILGRSRQWLIAMTVLAPLALLVWKIGWSGIFGNLDESPHLGYRCLLMSMTMGAVPLVLLAMTRTGDEPRHPGLLGAAMGVAVGACGWVLTDLWCPVAGPIHLLRGHLLPIMLLGILGVAIGRSTLGIRARL